MRVRWLNDVSPSTRRKAERQIGPLPGFSAADLSELEVKRSEIESLCRRTNVVSLDLFGSVASREFRPEVSDLDFVVTFAEFPKGDL
ncbi:MAG: nucleotidyltransferase domain-containing protein [Verrucomicrobia bacterium]|nr:nucleotidyltransferase domain-containing protein [Verrucomicrobiota bacterium]